MNSFVVILRRLLLGALGLPFGGSPLALVLIRRLRARRAATQAFLASCQGRMTSMDQSRPWTPDQQMPLPLGPPISYRRLRRHQRRYFS